MSLRYAFIHLRRSPVFFGAAILVLGLGLGATTAVFTFVRGILLQPLEFPESNRLLILCETNAAVAGHCVASPPNAADWAARARTLEGIGQAREWGFRVRNGAYARNINAGLATPQFFDVLRAQPLHGRLFAPDETSQQRAPVAVLTHELWRTWFASDPGIVGRTIEVDQQAFTVIGVLDASFEVPGLARAALWVPFHFDPRDEDRRAWRGFMTVGRLAAGATRQQATLELERIQVQLAQEHPEANAGWGVSVSTLKSHVVQSARPRLLVFSAAVALLLLITCANVAALLLVRATARQHEVAVRIALGASTGTLVRQVIAESVALGLCAAVAAFALAWSVVRLFVRFAPASVPRIGEIRVDLVVFAFALALALLTALLVSIIPALRVARTHSYGTLREAARQTTARGGLRARRVLVVLEVAVALALLVGSALFVRSFTSLLDWKPGFEREQLIAVSLFAPPGKFESRARLAALFPELEHQLAAIPGVTAVGSVSAGPLFGGRESGRFRVRGYTYATAQDAATLRWFDASPAYLATLGLPLLRGRMLAEEDRLDGTPVAVINDAAARRYFGSDDPVGRQLDWIDVEQSFQVVGVVGSVQPLNAAQPPEPEIYWSNRQLPRLATFFLVRTSTTPNALLATVERTLQQADPDFSVGSARSLTELLDRELISPRFQLMLLAAVALVALLLAGAGVFGVLAYAVALRTSEFGIRIALGARPAQLLRSVLGEALRLSAAGLALGLLAAFALARLMAGLLFGISALDPMAYTTAVGLLLIICLLASAVPAWRASRVQPGVTLHPE